MMMLQNGSLCSYDHDAIPRHKEVPCTDHLHIALKLLCYPALLSSHTCILFTQILAAITMTNKNLLGEMIICQRRLQVITTSKWKNLECCHAHRLWVCYLGLRPTYCCDVELSEMKLWYVKLTTFSIIDFFSSPLHTNNWKYIKKLQHKLKFNTVSYTFPLHYIPIIESILRNYNIN